MVKLFGLDFASLDVDADLALEDGPRETSVIRSLTRLTMHHSPQAHPSSNRGGTSPPPPLALAVQVVQPSTPSTFVEVVVADAADAEEVTSKPPKHTTIVTSTSSSDPVASKFVVTVLTQRELIDAALANASVCLFPHLNPPNPSQQQQQQSPVGGRGGRVRDIRVYCNFLAANKKQCSFNIRLKDAVGSRNLDLVDATIKVFLSMEEHRNKYSANPRHYKLFLADEQTGEEESPIHLDNSCNPNFTSLSVQPLPQAKLFLFPQRLQMLSTVADDITLTIEIRSTVDDTVRHVKKLFPADLMVEKLEKEIISTLTSFKIIAGSLRVRYGPVEVDVEDRYDFGPGCGASESPLSEKTILSLYRFGVTDIIVKGTAITSEDSDAASSGGIGSSLAGSTLVSESSMSFKRLDEEEAKTYQQFDVVKVNKFGVRQDRVIGVDGERIYNMRPSSEIGKTKNPERSISDIELIRDFRERPAYCEVEYNKLSKYDTDRIEMKNAFECAVFVEKLRVLKKIQDRKIESKKNETPISRFFGRLGFGK